jgi:hypothetical protein
MRRSLVTAVVVAFTVLAVVPAPAQAQVEDSQLGGYVAAAGGWAVSFQPFLPALLPTGDAPVETTFSLSTARVTSGDQAAARAALLWPGAAAANLGPLLEQGAGVPGVAGLLPPYPGFIEANAGSGEVVRAVGPLASMRAFGSPSRSEADVRTPDVNVPGVLKIDSVSSNSVADVTDVDVTSGCVVHLNGVSILGGGVKIAAIHSRSSTSSTGSTATSDGDLEVVGLTVGGIAAELTADGVRFAGIPQSDGVPGVGAPFPGANPDAQLTQALASLGVTIRLTRAVEKISGGTADRLANGVFVSIINPAVEGGRFEFTLASTGSSAQASLPVDTGLDELDLTPIADDVTGALSPPTDLGIDDGAFGSSALGDLAVGPSSPGGAVAADGSVGGLDGDPVSYSFDGVPWQLVVGLLVASALIGRWIRRFLVSNLIPDGGSSGH